MNFFKDATAQTFEKRMRPLGGLVPVAQGVANRTDRNLCDTCHMGRPRSWAFRVCPAGAAAKRQ